MMSTVKNAFHTIGDRGGDIARTVGGSTADLAKRVGGSTADLAKRIGPRRGLIGLAVILAAVGGSIVLVRYLRTRDDEEAAALEDELGSPAKRSGKRNGKHGQASQATAR
jgi:hypothetical protein